jgi:hypothetical protein
MDRKLNNWTDLWEKAQKEGVFGDSAQPVPENPIPYASHEPKGHDNVDKEYWNNVYANSRHAGDAPDPFTKPEVLNDWNVVSGDRTTPQPQPLKSDLTDKEKGDVVRTAADAANPIEPSSVGKDQNYKPNWADVQQLEQLHDMKVNLHELESKLNAGDAMATDKGQKIQKQIDSLRVRMDELSDELTPDFLRSYLS